MANQSKKGSVLYAIGYGLLSWFIIAVLSALITLIFGPLLGLSGISTGGIIAPIMAVIISLKNYQSTFALKRILVMSVVAGLIYGVLILCLSVYVAGGTSA